MLGTVKGLGERALHMAGVPLRWVGTQLEQGRVDAAEQRAESEQDARRRFDEMLKRVRCELLGLAR